ncbi:MAG TPA: TrmH family RNA methyltransferase [Bacillota bacterium]|nr:TrmH family RNA methyltransferase [Bacillota bacterium]
MSVKVKKIYSENNDFQHIEVIKRNREKRNKYKEFFVEGVKSIELALKNHWEIVSYIYSSERRLSQWATNILEHSKAETHFDLPLSLMEKLSDRNEGSELMAVVSMPGNDRSRIKIDSNLLLIVFDRPSSPGNLGTMIRSCDAFKANGLIITGHGVDIYDPQTIRSSIGTLFSLPVLRMEQNELFEWFKELKEVYGDLSLIGTSAKAERYINEVDFTKPTVLLLGNETEGLSKNYKSSCHQLVKIPIWGSASSLNVACAASISLYEIDSQRRATGKSKSIPLT